MAISLPSDLVVDLRDPILGDSYNWSGLESAASKRSLVFHHSASDAPAEDGFSIADYHVNHNGWGGIGYHFVITRSDYPGRPGQTQPGAQIQYVGDLGTYRAHVANQNPTRVGICFVGITPDAAQLRLGRKLVDFLRSPNNILPSINYYNQVTVHRLVPDQSTSCPGDDFQNWLPYLQGGDFPAYLNPAPAPAPAPAPTPEPAPAAVDPEYVRTYIGYPSARKMIVTADLMAIDAAGVKAPVGPIKTGTELDILGEFTNNGVKFYRTVYSASNGLWMGLNAASVGNGTPSAPVVPVAVVSPEEATPSPHIVDVRTPEITPAVTLVSLLAKILAPILKLFRKA